MTTRPQAHRPPQPMIYPFPVPGAQVQLAYRELNLAINGRDAMQVLRQTSFNLGRQRAGGDDVQNEIVGLEGLESEWAFRSCKEALNDS